MLKIIRSAFSETSLNFVGEDCPQEYWIAFFSRKPAAINKTTRTLLFEPNRLILTKFLTFSERGQDRSLTSSSLFQ